MKSVILQIKYSGSDNKYFYLKHEYYERDKCREFIQQLGDVVAAFFITKYKPNETNNDNSRV